MDAPAARPCARKEGPTSARGQINQHDACSHCSTAIQANSAVVLHRAADMPLPSMSPLMHCLQPGILRRCFSNGAHGHHISSHAATHATIFAGVIAAAPMSPAVELARSPFTIRQWFRSGSPE
jgi:hypothetical protein